MLSLDNACTRLNDLITIARTNGADAADAIYVGSASTDVQMRLGRLEDVGRSEGEEIALRVFVGHRTASVSGSDLSRDGLQSLAARVVDMAREATEDQYAGLAPEDRLASGALPDLDLHDEAEPGPAALKERALTAEDAARAIAGVTNSEGASASSGQSVMAIATSHGFVRGYRGSSFGCSASVIAGEGSNMQRDYGWHSTRHLGDLEDPALIGNRAGERAVARLNPVKIDSGSLPILFDPRVGSTFLGHLLGAITGSSIARRTSFLLDSLNQLVFDSAVTILDNPHRLRGLRSRPFDGEGLPTAPSALIDKGRLTGWLLESASARQLGLQPTGHATRGIGGPPGAGATNVTLEPGTVTPAALMADIKQGIYVTELIGQGVNGVTGDYSRGASGRMIIDGQLGPPVAEITIAGNLKDMFRALIPANDLVIRRGMDTPTLRIDGMMVAGG
jgi:PmbA protein